MAKKGTYRKVVSVDIVKDYSALKADTTVEMHPLLAKDLIGKGVAKLASKKKQSAE